MKILLDANIVIDWALKSRKFHKIAAKIFDLCFDKKVQSCVAAHTITNVFYIVRNDYNLEERLELSEVLCRLHEVAPINHTTIQQAIDMLYPMDLEDALQIQCAIDIGAYYIIARNIKDFKASPVKALLPEEFLEIWNGFNNDNN